MTGTPYQIIRLSIIVIGDHAKGDLWHIFNKCGDNMCGFSALIDTFTPLFFAANSPSTISSSLMLL